MHLDYLSPHERLILRAVLRIVRIGSVLCVALLALAATFAALAREQFPGQYAQSDPATREWFNQQTIPGTERRCCSTADGVFAEEEIRDGHYWARFVVNFIDQRSGLPAEHKVDWMRVPDDVVIHDANRHGAPVVWWYFDGDWKIRCYAPGGGV